MSDPIIPLDHLYSAIEEQIAQAIPGLAYICTMPDILQHVPIPAVVLELVELEPGRDPGTGEVGAEARFEARIIVGSDHEHCQQVAAFIAAQLIICCACRHGDWRSSRQSSSRLHRTGPGQNSTAMRCGSSSGPRGFT